jgi:hypothetical protein
MTPKPLFVGVHPAYARRANVELQTQFARPDVQVVYARDTLAQQGAAWVRGV